MKWTQEGAEHDKEERRHSPDEEPHEATGEADQAKDGGSGGSGTQSLKGTRSGER